MEGVPQKQKQKRAELARKVDEYLKKGGQIKRLEVLVRGPVKGRWMCG